MGQKTALLVILLSIVGTCRVSASENLNDGAGSRCADNPMAQTACTSNELARCKCSSEFYCCLAGGAAGGCSAVKWTYGACTCACQIVPTTPPNCTFDQFLYSPCGPTDPYYCPSTSGCGPNLNSLVGCFDLCYLTKEPPYPARPADIGKYTPSDTLKFEAEYCGDQTLTAGPSCTTQPNDPNWSHAAERNQICAYGAKWCPKSLPGWKPSIYQCGPTLNATSQCPMKDIQSQQCRVAPMYSPPSWAPKLQTSTGYCDTSRNCDNVHSASHCVGCCSWNNPELKCYNYSQEGKGKACTQVSPRWNWIITTCDTMGGLDFGGACQQNPFSQVNIRYIAVYQLTKTPSGQFVWQIIPESSVNYKGSQRYVDLSQLPTEGTIGSGSGPVKSCSGGGGGWNGAFFPYKAMGATPPAFMFVLSYDKFYNAAWFMLNQRILDGGPQTPTCKAMTNCWGEISAGEIDFLETPNLFPSKFQNQQGWNYYRTTSYNAANRCWACNHANHNGTKNIAGCGGEPAASFYNANAETDSLGAHYWAAVIDARGTTVYKDPKWPGLFQGCAAETLVNLYPEQPEQQQPCTDPTKTCAIYLPGCVTKISPQMSSITGGDYSRIPQCWYEDWKDHTTCSENWWNLMMDTGQWVIKDPPLA